MWLPGYWGSELVFDANLLLRQLSELGKQLDEQVEKLGELDFIATGKYCEAARIKEEYEDALAKVFLVSEGSVETRKATARLKCVPSRLMAQDAMKDAKEAEAHVRNQQAAVRALQSRIDIGRSLLSSEKARMQMDGLQ